VQVVEPHEILLVAAENELEEREECDAAGRRVLAPVNGQLHGRLDLRMRSA